MKEAMQESSFRTLPGGTGTSASYSEALSVMSSVDVTTFAMKQEPASSEFSVLSGAGLLPSF